MGDEVAPNPISVLISDTNERCAERKAEGHANVEAEIEVAEPKVKLLEPPEVRRGKEGFAHRSSGENIRLLVTTQICQF